MSIHGASATMYSVDGLRFVHLHQIAKEFERSNGNAVGPPKIYVDCNNAWFRGGKLVASVVTLLIRLAAVGFTVVPVCDGTRPIGKQATPMRAADREKARIRSFALRAEITELQHKLNTQQLTGDERTALEKEMSDSNTALKRKETASQNAISANFVEELREGLALANAHGEGGTVVEVYLAEYQADPVLVQSVLSKECALVISDDGDVAVLGGDGCIEVMNYTKDEKIKIRSASLKTLKRAIGYIANSSVRQAKLASIVQGTGNPRQKFYPVFEGVTGLNARAAMGLILGCDAIPKGVLGADPRYVSLSHSISFSI